MNLKIKKVFFFQGLIEFSFKNYIYPYVGFIRLFELTELTFFLLLHKK